MLHPFLSLANGARLRHIREGATKPFPGGLLAKTQGA
jgi:hypothetical protein